MYLCRVEPGNPAVLHLAITLFAGESEALCGQRVTVGSSTSWLQAIQMTNCTTCRSAAAPFRPTGLGAGR